MTVLQYFGQRFLVPRLPPALTPVHFRYWLVFFVIMAGIRLGFSQKPSGGRVVFPPYEHQDAVSTLAQSQNNFTRDLYAKLAKESNGNLFFSPFSIMTALGMTLAGSRGNTKAEIHKVLHLAEDNEGVHDAFSDVVADLKTEAPEYELRTANMAYVSDRLNILADYVKILTEKYISTSETVDFNQEPVVRAKINGAVEKETNSRIKDLIPEGILGEDTRMVLVNAVYFKGLWMHQFQENRTCDQDFWTSATSSIKIPMMSIKKRFGYQVNEDIGATMLKMSYKGSRLSMVFVLPDARDGLADVESKLAQANLNEMERFHEVEVEVTIPKFKLEESLDLVEHLAGMGMKDLFREGLADLSGISGTKELYVSNVIHKAFLEVNEKGSEAAAATGVVIEARSLQLDLLSFIADHPFLFYIRDQASGLVLFAGRLVGPNQIPPKDEL